MNERETSMEKPRAKDWPRSRTFRLQEQEGLLIADNRTNQYACGSRRKRKKGSGARRRARRTSALSGFAGTRPLVGSGTAPMGR